MAALEPQQGDETYYFESKPKALGTSKYRLQYTEDDGEIFYGNIMYDRRVIRGNTYASNADALIHKLDPIEKARQEEIRRRKRARHRLRQYYRPVSPPPIVGRQHAEVQTEMYLEAISDRVEQTDSSAQTDYLIDRPSTPIFTPGKVGKDAETQIYPNDIFDFNFEVRPMLELMICKTIEQSKIEVLEEEELASLRQQQREFEEIRNAEFDEMQRLEEQERRRVEEKKQRMKQQTEAFLMERDTELKIASQVFAASYLLDLLPSVFSTMHTKGFFFDLTERYVEENLLPELEDVAATMVVNNIVARTLLDGVIRDVCLERLDSYKVVEARPPSPPYIPEFVEKPKFVEKEIPEAMKCTVEQSMDEYTYEGSC